MSEEEKQKTENEEFDQEANERAAWAARDWDFDEEPEIDPEIVNAVEELIKAQMVGEEEDESK